MNKLKYISALAPMLFQYNNTHCEGIKPNKYDHDCAINPNHVGTEMSSSEFNKYYKNCTFVKVLRKDKTHHGFTYTVNKENVDPIKFNPSGNCEPGGLYATLLVHAPTFFELGQNVHKVTVPDDARIYIDSKKKIKVDRLFLTDICQPNEELDAFKDEQFFLKMFECNDVFEFDFKNINFDNFSENTQIEMVKKDSIMFRPTKYMANCTILMNFSWKLQVMTLVHLIRHRRLRLTIL